MNIRDAYNAKAIAVRHTEAASNKQAYLGAGLFPNKKKTGLDLKWIKTSKGLPVSLAPSAFDTVSTLRSREGFKITETEMAFFKESMLVKENDEQEIMRVQDSSDPFAQEVLDRIYDDAETLLEGAEVVYLLLVPGRLIRELVAGEIQDLKSLLLHLLIHLFQRLIMRGKTAAGGGVDDEHDFAAVLLEREVFAEAGLEGEIVNACHSGSSFERSLQGMWGDARAPLSCLQLDCTQFIRKMQP